MLFSTNDAFNVALNVPPTMMNFWGLNIPPNLTLATPLITFSKTNALVFSHPLLSFSLGNLLHQWFLFCCSRSTSWGRCVAFSLMFFLFTSGYR